MLEGGMRLEGRSPVFGLGGGRVKTDTRGKMEICREAMRQANEERMERIKNHPDNGKNGWWIVEGIRHRAYAKASSAIEAIEKAEKAGVVQDWECAESWFWTEELPDVF
jgi:hypothetical protein